MPQTELHVIHSTEEFSQIKPTSFKVQQSFNNTNFIRTHISFPISSTRDINITNFAIFAHSIMASVTMATKLFAFPVFNNVEMGGL